MKKYFLGTLILASIMLTQSCKSGGANTPTGTLKSMAADAKQGDFKAMVKNFCKADAAFMESMMPMMEMAAKASGKSMKDLMKESMEKNGDLNLNDVEFKNEKVDGDNATIDVFSKKENTTTPMTMKKEGGSWKVCMGIADKAKNAMSEGLGGMDKLKDATDKLSSPEMQKQIQNAMTPENMEKMKDMMKNVKPEDIQKMKEAMEKMGKSQ
jgi:hypothetical protein